MSPGLVAFNGPLGRAFHTECLIRATKARGSSAQKEMLETTKEERCRAEALL